jgi:hypothetical protein
VSYTTSTISLTKGQSGWGVALTTTLSNADIKERVELYRYFPVNLHDLLKGELYHKRYR